MTIAAIKMSANEKRNHPKVWEALAAQYDCIEMGDDTGDFHIATEDGNLLIVERKSPSDLVGSIRSGRLFAQATKYKAETKWVYFVITGTISYSTNGKAVMYRPGSNWTKTGWDFAAVQGAILSLQELGCFVLYCAGESDFVPCIVRLGNRSRNAIPVMPAREPIVLGPFGETPNGKLLSEQQRIGANILLGFQGIGPDRAIGIMEHFPHFAAAMWYLTDPHWDGEKITGIGNGIKEQIIKQCGAPLVLNGGNDNE